MNVIIIGGESQWDKNLAADVIRETTKAKRSPSIILYRSDIVRFFWKKFNLRKKFVNKKDEKFSPEVTEQVKRELDFIMESDPVALTSVILSFITVLEHRYDNVIIPDLDIKNEYGYFVEACECMTEMNLYPVYINGRTPGKTTQFDGGTKFSDIGDLTVEEFESIANEEVPEIAVDPILDPEHECFKSMVFAYVMTKFYLNDITIDAFKPILKADTSSEEGSNE